MKNQNVEFPQQVTRNVQGNTSIKFDYLLPGKCSHFKFVKIGKVIHGSITRLSTLHIMTLCSPEPHLFARIGW